jgi:hypothetical protein
MFMLLIDFVNVCFVSATNAKCWMIGVWDRDLNILGAVDLLRNSSLRFLQFSIHHSHRLENI